MSTIAVFARGAARRLAAAAWMLAALATRGAIGSDRPADPTGPSVPIPPGTVLIWQLPEEDRDFYVVTPAAVGPDGRPQGLPKLAHRKHAFRVRVANDLEVPRRLEVEYFPKNGRDYRPAAPGSWTWDPADGRLVLEPARFGEGRSPNVRVSAEGWLFPWTPLELATEPAERELALKPVVFPPDLASVPEGLRRHWRLVEPGTEDAADLWEKPQVPRPVYSWYDRAWPQREYRLVIPGYAPARVYIDEYRRIRLWDGNMPAAGTLKVALAGRLPEEWSVPLTNWPEAESIVVEVGRSLGMRASGSEAAFSLPALYEAAGRAAEAEKKPALAGFSRLESEGRVRIATSARTRSLFRAAKEICIELGRKQRRPTPERSELAVTADLAAAIYDLTIRYPGKDRATPSLALAYEAGNGAWSAPADGSFRWADSSRHKLSLIPAAFGASARAKVRVSSEAIKEKVVDLENGDRTVVLSAAALELLLPGDLEPNRPVAVRLTDPRTLRTILRTVPQRTSQALTGATWDVWNGAVVEVRAAGRLPMVFERLDDSIVDAGAWTATAGVRPRVLVVSVNAPLSAAGNDLLERTWKQALEDTGRAAVEGLGKYGAGAVRVEGLAVVGPHRGNWPPQAPGRPFLRGRALYRKGPAEWLPAVEDTKVAAERHRGRLERALGSLRAEGSMRHPDATSALWPVVRELLLDGDVLRGDEVTRLVLITPDGVGPPPDELRALLDAKRSEGSLRFATLVVTAHAGVDWVAQDGYRATVVAVSLRGYRAELGRAVDGALRDVLDAPAPRVGAAAAPGER
jgi:hypothetical protein